MPGTRYCLLFLVMLAGFAPRPARSQSSAPEYVIREDQPRTGSHIRRDEVAGSTIPLNKRYYELSAAERETLNQGYEPMERGDEPPFPAEGLRPIYDAIRKAQKKLLVEGNLFLVADVGADGKVTQVSVFDSPSEKMTSFAGSVLLMTAFKPALCGGKACKMQYPFRMTFAVEN